MNGGFPDGTPISLAPRRTIDGVIVGFVNGGDRTSVANVSRSGAIVEGVSTW